MFLSGLKVLIDLMSPIEPIEIRSSTPMPVLSNFFAIYTTRRRLCSIRVAFVNSESVPLRRFSISISSSDGDRGGGRVSVPPM